MKGVLLAVLIMGSVIGLVAWRQAAPTPVRWQYHTWSPGRGWEARLDSLGAEGWELVAVDRQSSMASADLYFKRPLP